MSPDLDLMVTQVGFVDRTNGQPQHPLLDTFERPDIGHEQRRYQKHGTVTYAEGIGRVLRRALCVRDRREQGETMRRVMSVALAVMLMVSVTGCAKAAEKVSEKVAEKAVENSGGGNANVDISGNGGTVQVQTEEGSATFGGGKVPASIDVSLPSGGAVMASTDTSTEATVMVQYAGANFDDIVASLQKWVDGAPGDFQTATMSASGVQSQTWNSNTTTIGVQTCASSSGAMDSVCVYVTVEKG
jgi:hypothetical protein